MFVVGYNGNGDLGLDECETAHTLIPCPENKIAKAFSGRLYSIYADHNYDNLWSAGHNTFGSCGVGKRKEILNQLTPITYFNKHAIKIKQVSVTPSGHGSFFLSKDNKLYACGCNVKGQLGIKSIGDFYKPVLVSDLENKYIIDIKSSWDYSIAICSDNHPKFILIITNWSRLYSLSQDIINLIISFMQAIEVFATTTEPGTGHLKNDETINKKGWNMVDSFKDKNIVKCDVGAYHSMFLEDNGVLWTCGLSNTGSAIISKLAVHTSSCNITDIGNLQYLILK